VVIACGKVGEVVGGIGICKVVDSSAPAIEVSRSDVGPLEKHYAESIC